MSQPFPDPSHIADNEGDFFEEISFGDFASLLGRQDMMDADFSVIEREDPISPPLFAEDVDSKKYYELHQHYVNAQETIHQLRHRLSRRTGTIDTIRKHYLRDVVTMKHILKEMLTDTERRHAWKQYEHILPSLDLKETLDLHAPEKCTFKVTPCGMCGGKLELVLKDNEEAEQLKKTIKESKEREGRWRVKLADLDAHLENVQKEKAEASKSHGEEKRVLYLEMKKLREEVEQCRTETSTVRLHNKRMKEENEAYRKENAELRVSANKLVVVEKELEIAKTNLEELADINKALKTLEKNLNKDVAALRSELKELTASNEALQDTIKYLQQENKQLNANIERMQSTHEEIETNLEVSNRNNLEFSKKVFELEDAVRQNNEENAKLIESYENNMEKVRNEGKALSKKMNDLIGDNRKLKKMIEDKNIIIEDLQRINHHLQLDVRDNREEIELLEQERKHMQDLIKQKIVAQAGKSKDVEKNDLMNLLNRLNAMEIALEAAQQKATLNNAEGNAVATPAALPPVAKDEEHVTRLLQRRTELRLQRELRKSQVFDAAALATPPPEIVDESDDLHHPREKKEKRAKTEEKKKSKKTEKATKVKRKPVADHVAQGSHHPHIVSDMVEQVAELQHALEDDDVAIDDQGEGEGDGQGSEDESNEDKLNSPPKPKRKSKNSSLIVNMHSSEGQARKQTAVIKPKSKKASKTRKSVAASKSSVSSSNKASSKAHTIAQQVISSGGDDGVQAAVQHAVNALQESDSGDDGFEEEEQAEDDEDDANNEDDHDSVDAQDDAACDDANVKDAPEANPLSVAQDGLFPVVASVAPRKQRKRSKEKKEKIVKARPKAKVAKTKKAPAPAPAAQIVQHVPNISVVELELEEEDIDEIESSEDELTVAEELEVVAADVESSEDELEEPESPEPEPIPVASGDEETDARAVEEAAMLAAQKAHERAERAAARATHKAEKDVRKALKLKEKETREAENTARRLRNEAIRQEQAAKKQAKAAEKARIRAAHESKLREEKKVKLIHEAERKALAQTQSVEDDDDEEEDEEDTGSDDSGSDEGLVEDEELEADDNEADASGVEERVVQPYSAIRKPSNSRKTSPAPIKTKKAPPAKPLKPVKAVSKPIAPENELESEECDSSVPHPDAPVPDVAVMVTSAAVKKILPSRKRSLENKTDRGDSGEVRIFLEAIIRDQFMPVCLEAADVLGVEAEELMDMYGDAVEVTCNAFDKSLQVMWESMLCNKESLDLAQKVFAVVQELLNSAEYDSEDISKSLPKLVALAGALSSPSMTEQWAKASAVDPEHLLDLAPTSSTDADLPSNRPYSDVFQLSQLADATALQDKLDSIYGNAYKMSAYFHDLHVDLNSNLVNFLSDWSASKLNSIELAMKLEDDIANLKHHYDQKIVAMTKEMTKNSSLMEKTMDKLKTAELKIKEFMKMEVAMKELEANYQSLTHHYEITTQKLADITLDYNIVKGEYKLYGQHLLGLTEIMGMCEAEADVHKRNYELTLLQRNNLQRDLLESNQAYNQLHSRYSELVDREYARLHLLSTVSMQTEPEVFECAVQTEFLVPPMDLKTVVMDKLSRSSMRNYPMVFSQSLDHLPALSIAQSTSARRTNNAEHGTTHTPMLLAKPRSSQSKLASSRPDTISHHINSLLSVDQDGESVTESHLPVHQHNHSTQSLIPHSPPVGKYNKINDEDLMSFLSLRLPSAQNIDATSPRSINSGSSSNASPSVTSKGKLIKNRWGSSSGPLARVDSVREGVNDMFLSNSAARPSHSTRHSVHIQSDELSSEQGSEYFDTINVSGPPSPASASGRYKAAALPEVKQIVYNHKMAAAGDDGRFRTVKPHLPVADSSALMVTNTPNKAGGIQASFPASASASKPRAAAAGRGRAADGHLPQIAANSETIKKMRKELLSR